MNNNTKANDSKRGARGKGRLYIRLKGGKQLKAGATNHNGVYWLEYWQSTDKTGPDGKLLKKKKRIKLVDESDAPITTLGKAEEARDKELRLNVAASKAERLAQIKAELEAAETQKEKAFNEANPPLTIAKAWDEFKDHPKLDCGATLLYNYACHWKQFREWLGRHDPDAVYMRDISRKTAQDYARHLSQRKVSPGTYNKHVNFFKRIFSVLRDEIRSDVSPFAELPTKNLAKAKAKASARQRKRRELSSDELIDVLDKGEGNLQVLLMLGAYTGLRLGDCCTLRWDEVLLDRGMIKRVPDKNQADPIKIGIPPRLVSRLAETPKSKRKGYVLPKYAEDYTYISDKGKHTHCTRITNQIQNHFELTCGISTHAEGTGYQYEPDPDNEGEFIRVHTGKRAVVEVGFHSLRHTFVSMQAEMGTPQAIIQKIVGHGSPAMTMHYTHVSDEAARNATLFIGDGVKDADFEEIRTPIPNWAREIVESGVADDWDEIKAELLRVN